MSIIITKDATPKPFLKVMVMSLYCVALLLISLYAYKRPHYNWDMLGYMALILQPDHSDVGQLHQITYKEAKDNIPAIEFDDLVTSEHKKKLAADPQSFFKTLPFYAVKPLYIRTAGLFYKAGFSLPIATVMPSIIFYFLTGLFLFYWISQHIKVMWAFFAGLFIMLSGFMVFMARLSTPDCMSSFFLLVSFYCILEKPSVKWLFFFLLLSVFTRLDNIVPALFILSFLFFTKKWQHQVTLKQYLLMLFIVAVCYIVITVITMRSFGWNVLYYPTYALHMNLSHSVYSSFSVEAYIELAISQVITGLIFNHFIFFLIFLLLIIYSPAGNYKRFSIDQSFSILLLLIIVVRFILYPDLSDRFNVAYYLCFIITLIKRYSGFTLYAYSR